VSAFPRLSLLVALIAITLVVGTLGVWTLVDRDGARSWRQAAIISSEVGDVPIGRNVAGWLTHEPRDVRVLTAGGLPATMIRPGGAEDRTAPAVVVLVPNGTSARELKQLENVQHAVARAGMVAWAVRVPDPGESLGSTRELGKLRSAMLGIASDPSTRDGHVSIIAAGAIASQALVVASEPEVDRFVQAMLVVQPVADVQGLVRLAVTGTARNTLGADVAHPAAARLRRTAARALVRTLREQAPNTLSPIVGRLLDAAIDQDDPLAALRRIPPRLLRGDLRALRRVLTTDDPRQFDAAWTLLPASLLMEASALSPTEVVADLDARVLLGGPLDDTQYPIEDTFRIAAQLNDRRVRVTRLLDVDGRADASSAGARSTVRDIAWWLEQAGS